MENLNEDVLLKVRSSRACIGAGYRLFTGNFKKIFRYSWLAALVYGLCNGIYTSYMVTEYPKMLLAATTGQLFAPGLIVPVLVTTLLPLLMFVASIWLCAHVFTLLTQHRSEGIITIPPKHFTMCTDKHSILRTTAWGILCLVIAFIAWVVVGGIIFYAVAGKSMTFMGLGALVGLAIALLMLPLAYPAMHYLTTRDTRLFKILGSDYLTGLRHWGMLFTVAFVTVVVSSAILTLTTLPAVILTIANVKAQAGQMMGDPLGMPDYIGKLTLLVFTLAGFIQAYVLLSTLFPAYYAAGSIETQEQEHNEKKNPLY